MKARSIIDPIKTFLYELERLSHDYEELTDTDVREAIHLTLNYFFIWGKKSDQFPVSYCMLSRAGDQAVARVVERFISVVDDYPNIARTPLGQARLDLIQDPDLKTPNGNIYDVFIGHINKPLPPAPLPDDLFYEGDYDGS